MHRVPSDRQDVIWRAVQSARALRGVVHVSDEHFWTWVPGGDRSGGVVVGSLTIVAQPGADCRAIRNRVRADLQPRSVPTE
eukprot:SAG31_NODE_35318_length_324_cov_0.924444_1_plen_80_part_10